MIEMFASLAVMFFVGSAGYHLIRLQKAKQHQKIQEMTDGELGSQQLPWDKGAVCSQHRLGEFCCWDCGPCNDKLCHRCFVDDRRQCVHADGHECCAECGPCNDLPCQRCFDPEYTADAFV
jgi:hypothetical protein